MFSLFNLIVTILLTVLDVALGLGDENFGILSGIYGLAVLVPSIAVGIRRLHDTGRSGWWTLIGLVPLVGALVLLIFDVQEGEAGSNKWGPNPKAEVNPYADSA
ncbi:uncharacterized membrane protein YhaH (DUF805 family) [Deinococcus yavapaiensis KR-236]|uniref:Uncharacterized membrane protein YhaH (DUF805 family) n=2 Tax=Deinococcus TaxID=1298 RepID=A0A318SGL9_9DEIO|nr:uncharacterized membrane protein YhaH (DUF805 family) [Deinococcus yavapaiensis KR-236]